jgi:hypothetical protein
VVELCMNVLCVIKGNSGGGSTGYAQYVASEEDQQGTNATALVDDGDFGLWKACISLLREHPEGTQALSRCQSGA